MKIYEHLIEEIKESSIIQSSGLSVEEIAVGLFYTGVKLSDGSLGISFTEASQITDENNRDRAMEEIPHLHLLHRQPMETLMQFAFSPLPLKSTIGAAVLNSLSDSLFRKYRSRFNVVEGDCFSYINVMKNEEVTMIGALPSYIRRIKDVAKKLTVIDNNPNIDQCEGHPVMRGEHTYDAIRTSDVLIMTGVTFTNSSVDYLTNLAPKSCRCAIVGPSAGPYPIPYFKKGISLVGSIEISNPDAIMAIIKHGGSIRQFREFSKKITVTGNYTEEY